MPKSSTQPTAAHRATPPWGIFAVFLMGTILAFWIYLSLRQLEEHSLEAAFNQQADLRMRSLRANLNYCREQIRTMAAFYSSSNFIDRGEFKAFVTPILDRQDAAVSVEWIPWVPKDKRAAFEKLAHEDGLPDFTIRDRSPEGDMQSAGVRDAYLPIFYQEPKSNPKTLGLDLATSPDHYFAIMEAREFNEITLGPCELPQKGTGPNPRMDFFQPVYERDPASLNHDCRVETFTGCYCMTFLLGQVAQRAWQGFDNSLLDCYLLDMAMPEGQRMLFENEFDPMELPHQWHDERPHVKPPPEDVLWTRKEVVSGGRHWQLLCLSTPRMAAAHRTFLPIGALACLLGFTMLLTVYLWSGRNRRILVEEQVQVRTEELEEARAGLEEKVMQRTLELRHANAELVATIEQLKRAQEALHVTQISVDTAAESMLRSDESGQVLEANETTCLRLGYRREQLCQMNLEALFEDIKRESWASRWANVTAGGLVFRDTQIAKDGRRIPVEITASRFRHGGRDLCSLFVKDLTEHKRLEEQLVQSQKMESVGRLAGGVAHDFNNILTVILGHCEVAMLANPDVPAASLTRIQEAANRAATLTRQLLAFARKHPCVARQTNLNDLARRSLSLVKPLLGERVNVLLDLAPDLGAVQVDPAQIEQVLLNLALNAKDAMMEGGTLAISTRMIQNADGLELDLLKRGARSFVKFTVSDTGTGMSAYVLQHLFEPFFTTKGAGKGTGLGLAMCYGIVKQNGGDIRVESEEGKGTTFSIYFPVAAPVAEAPVEAPAPSRPLTLSRNVLLVEDESEVRQLIADILTRNGCRVVQADTAESGERAAAAMHPPPDLLITDVVLPKANGRDLAKRVRTYYPGVRVLFVSGYTGDNAVQDDVKDGLAAFLPKPFSMQMLITKVNSIFEAPHDRARAVQPANQGERSDGERSLGT